jgi:pyruvate dehydrogenase E1 component beta subunit
VFDTPLAEAGIVGTAIGMAMNGLRPVVELQFDAFSYPAFEQITSHLAKLPNRTSGQLRLPVVVRIPYGGGIGGVEHHSDSSEAYFTHTPGLRVVTPGTPSDAYHLLRAAIASDDPVLFLEPKRRYWSTGEIDENATVDHSYALVNALIKAGRRFDLKIWPGFNHYQLGPYVQMTFWDHFVRYLLGQPLPQDFTPGAPTPAR